MESTNFGSKDESVFSEGILLGGFFLTQPVVIPELERIPPEGLLTVSKCWENSFLTTGCIGIPRIAEPREPNAPGRWASTSVF